MTAGKNQKLEFSRPQKAVTRVIENEAAVGNAFFGVVWPGWRHSRFISGHCDCSAREASGFPAHTALAIPQD